MLRARTLLIAATALALVANVANAGFPSADTVRQATGVRVGLAVVLGTTDGELEAGLAGDGKMLVQGLTLDQSACIKARRHLFQERLSGVASVDQVDTLRTLPYYDMLVNLLVADLDALGVAAPSVDEIDRVLGFRGVAYLKAGGKWQKHVRPMPPEADEFTHWAYDASRSNLSKDRLVGPPNALRWVGRPSDHNGYQGCRVGHGIVFIRSGSGQGNKSPEELTQRQPPRVFAKDAFSGVTLWTKILGSSGRGIEWGVVGKSCLFVYRTAPILTSQGTPLPGSSGELLLEGWNIHTGETEVSIPLGSLRERESKDFLKKYLWCLPNLAVTEGRLMYGFGPKLVIRDEETGHLRWEKDYSGRDGWVQSFMSADSTVVVLLGGASAVGRGGALTKHHTFKSLIGYRLEDGKEIWRIDGSQLWKDTDFDKPGARYFIWELEGYSNGLMPLCVFRRMADEQKFGDALLTLVDVKTGEQPWVARHRLHPTYSYAQHNKYIIGDRLYLGSLTNGAAFRMKDGSPIPESSWGDLLQGGGTGRGGPRSGNCCAGTATVRYMMLQRMFTPWDRLATFDHTQSETGLPDYWWARTFSLACRGRATPAYGTTYNAEGSCNCAVYISGSTALYGMKPTEELPDDTRRSTEYAGSLEASPLAEQTRAWDSIVATDWKLYPGRTAMCWSGPRTKHIDNRARGSIEVWGYGHNSTKPLSVGDLTIQGRTNEHLLTATRNGKPVWHFIAGGRIGARGELQTDGKRVFFGSHDGCVYAVNLADGTLAWRFLAAPADRRMVAFGQVESSWPIFNVVPEDGKLYCCAGRHQDIDGGLHFWCLEAETGNPVWHSCYKSGLPTQAEIDQLNNSPRTLVPTTYGMNNELTIEGDKLVLHAESCMPLKLEKNGFDDVVMNPDGLVPPEYED